MKLAAVGVGNAGSRIVNQLLRIEQASDRSLFDGNALLVDSTTPAFDTTVNVPDERRVMIGDVNWTGDEIDISNDPDRGAEVALEERNEINRAFDLIEFHEVDAVLVVAGLAGGTGGGAGAVIVDQLQSICDCPVYAVGVLPSESEGSNAALNAARSLQSFVARADNVITFDNDSWLHTDGSVDTTTATTAGARTEREGVEKPENDSPADGDHSVDAHSADDPSDDGEGTVDTAGIGDTIDEGNESVETHSVDDYVEVNVTLAERLFALFVASELEGTVVSENQLDPSDIIRTLDTGGLSAIGTASIDLPSTGGFGTWLRTVLGGFPGIPAYEAADDASTDAARINSLIRRAARSKLTLPCEIESADRALIVLSGPSRTLSRKGFESGRYWLETEADIVDVMAGDDPDEQAETLTAVVLFSNVTGVPRVDEMQETALEARHEPTVTPDGWRFGTANLS